MLNFEKLKMMLHDNGIDDVEEMSIEKNGIIRQGIRLQTPDGYACPIVYYSQLDTLEEFASRCIEAYNLRPHINADYVFTKEYIISHIHMAIQTPGGSEFKCKKQFLNLEIVLRIWICDEAEETFGTILVTDKIMSVIVKKTGFTIEQLWDVAYDNDSCRITVRSMEEMLGLPMGMTDSQIMVAGTMDLRYGSVSILHADVLHEVCNNQNAMACYIVPSSTEELLLLCEHYENEYDVDELLEMNRLVTESEVVAEELMLPVSIYRYDVSTKKVTIAAKYED